MILEVGSRMRTEQADEMQVADAIRDLARQAEDEAFAILSSDEMTYIQTVRTPDGRFGLEYQAGSLDEHYECYEDLDEATVRRVFLLYLRDDPRWHEERQWEKMDLCGAGSNPYDTLKHN
jgi:hypothetical protein